MKHNQWFYLAITLTLMTGVSACSLTFSQDVTPPTNYHPAAATQVPTASGPVYPLVPPDPQQGQAIYAEKCAACHGEVGLGDGRQAAKLPNPPAQIGLAEVARQSTPQEWFTIITQGNQAHYMMPFDNALSDRQRWDVLAYIYTLSAPADVIDTGKKVYIANCAGCHDKRTSSLETSPGRQSDAQAPQPSDLANQERMAKLSEAVLYQTTRSGILPNMPAYAGTLNIDQLWAVSSYVRALTFAAQPASVASSDTQATLADPTTTLQLVSTSASTPTVSPSSRATSNAGTTTTTPGAAQTSGSVNGKVIPPAGKTLPAGLSVTLVGFNDTQIFLSQKADVQPDGSFQFDKVDMPVGRMFIASVEYNQNEFDSDVATVTDNRTLSLPIPLYDTSTDKSALVTESMHALFDFSQPGIVQIIELLVITNPTDKMIVAAQPGQPVLEFAIPQDSTNLQVDQGQIGQRYIKTALGIGDTFGIKPGTRQTQVGFAYDLAYTDKLDLAFSVPIPAKVATFMLPPSNVKLQSTQLTASGQQSAQGMVLDLFTSSNVPAGTTINITLSGKPTTATPANSQNMTSLWIGAGTFAIVLMVSGLWFFRRRRSQMTAPLDLPDAEEPDTASDTDTLLDAIAALDDLHSARQIPETAYQQRRAELKAKLVEAFEQSGSEDRPQ